MLDRESNPPAVTRERRLVWLAVVALGVSCVMTQLALMREFLGALSGNELALGVVLGNWLLLMGIGAWLGRTADKFKKPLAVLAILQILAALVPLAQVLLLRALRNEIFVRGAAVGVTETVVSAFLLLLPYCLIAGFALTLACSLLAGDLGAPGIGRVYVADSLGSIAGGILFSFVFVRLCDHAGILIFPAVLNLATAAALGFHAGNKWFSAVAGTLAAVTAATPVLINLDGVSTGWQYPRQHLVARANSPYGRLLVTESDGQFDFIENGIPLTSTRDDQHVEETVHYAMAQRPDARTVLLVGGGISGTAREILKYHVSRVDYVELDPAILEFGRKFLPENLANPSSVAPITSGRRVDDRIRIFATDGRSFVRRPAEEYDVIILDMPDPSTAQVNRFFTVEFWAEAKRALAPNGVVSSALGHYENYVSPELARMLASANQSLKRSFANTLLIPGGRVYFVASDGPLYTDIASRIEQQGIKNKLMTRHYLDAMLMADRMADLQRALAQPAALNKDFSPMLYFYYLRHWMSQFQIGFGALEALLLVLLGIYLARLRGAAVAVFASGFTASALEIVLLLVFQALCGSVYYQLGIIVTVFMAGLAAGAMLTSLGTVPQTSKSAVSQVSKPATGLQLRPKPTWKSAIQQVWKPALHRNRRLLMLVAFSIALFALVLPIVLTIINRVPALNGSVLAVQIVIGLLTLALAALVGALFPLANRVEFDGTNRAASRLYAADFVGASLGALLASTLLIPLIGVAGVCLLTAGLNFLGGVLMQLRKATP